MGETEIDFLDLNDELDKLDQQYRIMEENFLSRKNAIPNEPHYEDLLENVKEVQDSKREVWEVDAAFQRVEMELERERKEIQRLKQEGDSYHKVAEDKLKQSEERISQLRRIKSDMVALKEKESQSDKAIHQKREQLEREISRERSALSLELVRTTEGSLLLNYTNIDRSQPDKKFVCEIKVVNRKYQAVETYPQIPDIDAIVAALNNSNDFSGFAVTIRKRFLKLLRD